jgi:hypothetical protein
MDGVTHLLGPGGVRRVPIALCLDVGRAHDLLAWLLRMGSRATVVQLHGSDVPADRVLAALDRSGAAEVALILEIEPPDEQDDQQVLADLEASASYWRHALRTHAARLGR